MKLFAKQKETFRDLRGKQQEREMMRGRPSTRLQDRIKTLEEELAELRERQPLIEETVPFVLGNVLLSSGKSLIENKILDWAFVELADSDSDEALEANKMPTVYRGEEPEVYGFQSGLHARKGEPLREFGELEKDSTTSKRAVVPGSPLGAVMVPSPGVIGPRRIGPVMTPKEGRSK